jgi:hypothetical protein
VLTATPTPAAIPSEPEEAPEPIEQAKPEAEKPSSSTERASARTTRSRKPKPPPRAPEPKEEASSDSSNERGARAASAKVRVKVFPWGRVWIDGKVRGSVPPILEVMLAPGNHEVAVGHEQPVQKRKISLSAGANELLSFDLEER